MQDATRLALCLCMVEVPDERLAQKLVQLLNFSTSFIDILSKVAEVLAFVESIPRGSIR